MKKTILIIGLFTMLLIACQNNSKTTNQNEVVTEKQDPIIHHEEEHGKQSNPVLLNNGAKWAANTETTEGIKKMAALTNKFPAKPVLEDYHSLKMKLETEFILILQKCTMTGEAHNQLHNYLLPMKGMFEDLNSQDIEVCSQTLIKIKEHLNEYENYFL